MNTPASSGGPIVALALTPPYIPSHTYPIIHPVAQVGLSRLNYYADSKGLLVLFGPYLDQEPDETGRIYLNGLPVPTPAQTTVDKTSPLRFLVPPGLLSNGVNNLKVNLQRQSGNEDSSELSVLHSLVAPAGNDPDPAPGNSLLNIDVTPKSIGPAEAAAGVKLTMSYLGMALYDLLTINYGGKTLTHQIVPTAQDPNPETKPVVLTFNTADFAHAPNNPQFIFKYNVISQIDDFSGTSSNGVFNPQEFWSKDHVVDVHLDRVERNPPIIVEAEANNRVLDVTALAGKNATIHALTWTGMVDGQPCWLKLLGFKADGSPHDLQLWNGLPARTNPTWISQGKYAQTVLNSYLAQLGDGRTLTVQFWVSEDKSNNFATATKFADQVYTVKALAAVVLAFLNGPYIATAGRQVTGIELLVTQAGQPSAGKTVSVTLPQGTTFTDGTSTGNFVTGSDGKVRLVGVTASRVAGTFSITAVSGGSTANASLTIVEEAPVGPIPLSSFAFGVAYSEDGKFAYTTGANYIQVIDTARSTVIKRIPVPATNSFEIALNQDASRAFVVDSGRVLAIDMSTNSLIADIPVAGWPIGIVLSKDGTQAFVSTWQGNSVVVINLVNFKVVKTIPVGPYPRGIDISPDGRRVYVANYGNGLSPGPSISVIDVQSLGVIRTVPLGPSAYDLAVSPDGNSVYVCANASTGGQYVQSLILHLNTQTWAKVKEILVPTYARCVVLNHSGSRAYCSSSFFQVGIPTSYAFTTIDTASGQVISTTPLRDRPYGVAISPDDSRVLVACTVNDFLWAIALLPETASQGVNSADLSGITSVCSQLTLPTPDDPMFP